MAECLIQKTATSPALTMVAPAETGFAPELIASTSSSSFASPSSSSSSSFSSPSLQAPGSLSELLESLWRGMLVVWCVQNRAIRSVHPHDSESDKTVTVSRESGEFGFRIHGSRPVVVSAIETRTPAEESGLEVGDIIMSINNMNVLDASHSEVVRLAHAGCDTLCLEVARTCDVLTPLVPHDPAPICAGYLYKLGGAHHPTTPAPNSTVAPSSSSSSSQVVRQWRRRWFALKKDHCLYYYKSEMEQHPLGAVQVGGHSVHQLGDDLECVGGQYPFSLGRGGVATLTLAAHSPLARHRWSQVLTQAAAHAAQRDDVVEACGRRVQHGPTTISAPDCFGFLHKLGARWHQWKRRYCVLKDASLYLYHDTDAAQAIGVVQLQGYRVQSTSIGGKKHAFDLMPPEPRFRHFYFYTDSDSDKKRWLAALEYSIDRWIKVV